MRGGEARQHAYNRGAVDPNCDVVAAVVDGSRQCVRQPRCKRRIVPQLVSYVSNRSKSLLTAGSVERSEAAPNRGADGRIVVRGYRALQMENQRIFAASGTHG